MQNYQFFCARLKYNIDKLIKINPKHIHTQLSPSPNNRIVLMLRWEGNHNTVVH